MANSFNYYHWWFWIYFIRACGLPFQLYPVRLPLNQERILSEATSKHDTVIVFNPGGWGEASLDEAVDFATILEGLQLTLNGLGNRSVIIPYNRVPPGLAGKIISTKEQLNSFKRTAPIQINEILSLAGNFPDKRFLILGFSVGGGLSSKALRILDELPNVYGITVGAPGWYATHSSEKSLVLNNANRDPVSVGDINTIARCVFKCPTTWIKAKIKRQNLSLPLALQFPYHDYIWTSEEVGPPIVKFLEKHFNILP